MPIHCSNFNSFQHSYVESWFLFKLNFSLLCRTIMEDTFRHKGLRKKLVAVVKRKGIKDQKVLDALMKIPRHWFLNSAFLDHAYEDKAFQIGQGQTISQPFTVAYQTALLEVFPAMKVLEIGTGSGYQAVVLAELGARVYSIERHKVLYNATKKFLKKIGYSRIKLAFGDGFKGLPGNAPYDAIIITAAAPEIPQVLKDQLKIGGKMVIPLDEGVHQIMIRLTKLSETKFKEERFDRFAFVPMLKGRSF